MLINGNRHWVNNSVLNSWRETNAQPPNCAKATIRIWSDSRSRCFIYMQTRIGHFRFQIFWRSLAEALIVRFKLYLLISCFDLNAPYILSRMQRRIDLPLWSSRGQAPREVEISRWISIGLQSSKNRLIDLRRPGSSFPNGKLQPALSLPTSASKL